MLVQSSFGGNIEQLEYSGFPITAWDTGGRVRCHAFLSASIIDSWGYPARRSYLSAGKQPCTCAKVLLPSGGSSDIHD